MAPGNARSCAQTGARFAATGESCAVAGARSNKTGAKPDPTCVSFARIDVTELRNRNCAQTVTKFVGISARCEATGASLDRIDAIYAVTVAISDVIDATPAINGK